jgi:hypothetical protein
MRCPDGTSHPRRRSLHGLCAISVGVLCVTALPGCGFQTSGEEQAVRRTMQRELVAMANGDGTTVCALATSHARARLGRAVRRISCPRAVAYANRFIPPAVKLGMRNATIGKVIVSGGVALVYDDQITSSQGTLEGFVTPGSPPTILLLDQTGTWRITSGGG